MGYMKELDIRLRSGGDEAVAAFLEYISRTSTIAGTVSADTGMEFIPAKSFAGISDGYKMPLIPDGYKMRSIGWVSVSERLPEDGTWCWVDWDGPGDPFPAMRQAWAEGGWTNTDTWEDFNREVTHWMPLPSPPEVKQ